MLIRVKTNTPNEILTKRTLPIVRFLSKSYSVLSFNITHTMVYFCYK
jgi:hypothetical protein